MVYLVGAGRYHRGEILGAGMSTNQLLMDLALALKAAQRDLKAHDLIIDAQLGRIVQLEQRLAALEPASTELEARTS